MLGSGESWPKEMKAETERSLGEKAQAIYVTNITAKHSSIKLCIQRNSLDRLPKKIA
jgi:hypothetical protein